MKQGNTKEALAKYDEALKCANDVEYGLTAGCFTEDEGEKARFFDGNYLPGYFERQCIRPGITGLWQISARERLSAAEMMVLDLRYVREASPWLDVKILARTAGYALASLAGETGR